MPSFDARPYIASTLRFSFRAITIFVFSRASVFSMRTSSFVHGRLRVIFFAISVPHGHHRSIDHHNARFIGGDHKIYEPQAECTHAPGETSTADYRS
jgi:hypothetical protein